MKERNKILLMLIFNEICDEGYEIFARGIDETIFFQMSDDSEAEQREIVLDSIKFYDVLRSFGIDGYHELINLGISHDEILKTEAVK